VITRKKKKFPGQSSAAATSQIDDLANLPSPPSEGKVLNSLVISSRRNIKHIFNLLIKIFSRINLEERKKTLRAHHFTYHQLFRYESIQ